MSMIPDEVKENQIAPPDLTDQENEAHIEESKAPLLSHLVELRQRLIKVIIGMIIAFGIALYFAEDIFQILAKPYSTDQLLESVASKIAESKGTAGDRGQERPDETTLSDSAFDELLGGEDW